MARGLGMDNGRLDGYTFVLHSLRSRHRTVSWNPSSDGPAHRALPVVSRGLLCCLRVCRGHVRRAPLAVAQSGQFFLPTRAVLPVRHCVHGHLFDYPSQADPEKADFFVVPVWGSSLVSRPSHHRTSPVTLRDYPPMPLVQLTFFPASEKCQSLLSPRHPPRRSCGCPRCGTSAAAGRTSTGPWPSGARRTSCRPTPPTTASADVREKSPAPHSFHREDLALGLACLATTPRSRRRRTLPQPESRRENPKFRADPEYRFELLDNGREGPLQPGEDWTDALPPLLAGTVLMDHYGMRLGSARADHPIDYTLKFNRTDWRAD